MLYKILLIILVFYAAWGLSDIIKRIYIHLFKEHIPFKKYKYQITKSNGDRLPDNEPVFIFRAQDKYAANVLRYYAFIVSMEKGNEYKIVADAILYAKNFDRWPFHKTPD